MDKINQKLNKYRIKLINAKSTDQMDFYNLKMQQYLIMQKKILKSGGGTHDIFALAEDTKNHLSSRNDVYSIDDVEKNLKSISEKLEQVSETYNANNKEMTEKFIDIRREAMKSINSKNFSESPSFNNINEAISAFKSIENIIINYYVEEIKSLNSSDFEKTDYILSELALFETNTIEEIAKLLEDAETIPEKIKNFFIRTQKTEEKLEKAANKEQEENKEEANLKGGKRGKFIYRKYF